MSYHSIRKLGMYWNPLSFPESECEVAALRANKF